MQAILTKFHGPTDTKGSRYSARCEAGRVVVCGDHRLNIERNHTAAAYALAAKLGWSGEWYGGQLPTGEYAFVLQWDESPAFEVLCKHSLKFGG
jgi:hypothetical protein